MTVCFSIKKPNFIVTASDVLAEDETVKRTLIHKKFYVNVERNFVILLSGSFSYDEKTPTPKKLFVEQIDNRINKRDSLRSVAEKILGLIHVTYSHAPEKIDLQLQICGFDGKIPHTYVVFSKKNDIEEHSTCVTGTQYVIDYTKTNEGKRRMLALNSLIPHVEIVEENVRRFVSDIIVYENKRAWENGEKPRTGCGINIVTVYPDEIAWPPPRFDSKDDPYKLD